MPCCHVDLPIEGGESAFAVDLSQVTFGPGVLVEAGESLRALGCRRIALFTDATIANLEPYATVRRSLAAAGLEVVVYDAVHVEPTDRSFVAAAQFAREGRFDGYLSLGGGSVIDTCKAALLYATHPAELLAYVNAPIGEGRAIPGPLPPHVACPTTCGTGSECTGIAIFDHLPLQAKTGIASRLLRPTQALVDPTCTHTLPPMVVAASGFDVLCHALESYTARPYTARPRPGAGARPMSQGRNPWSDLGSLEALRIAGKHLLHAVKEPSDTHAREALAWAATLAGLAFGNSGVHLPHAMSYAVAGLVRDYRCPGYPQAEPLVPHGISVIVSAPSVFRVTAAAAPARHLEAVRALGVDTHSATEADAARLLSSSLVSLMRDCGLPSGTGELGYTSADLPALAHGALLQRRLVDNAPVAIDGAAMGELFRETLANW